MSNVGYAFVYKLWRLKEPPAFRFCLFSHLVPRWEYRFSVLDGLGNGWESGDVGRRRSLFLFLIYIA
jgi:hypothetical protein